MGVHRLQRVPLHFNRNTHQKPSKVIYLLGKMGAPRDFQQIWRPWVAKGWVLLCPCGKAFQRERELQRHVASVHVKKTKETCPKCSEQFTRKDNLTRHLAYKHPEDAQGAKPICKYCLKPLSRKDAVRRHVATCPANPNPSPHQQQNFHNGMRSSPIECVVTPEPCESEEDPPSPHISVD